MKVESSSSSSSNESRDDTSSPPEVPPDNAANAQDNNSQQGATTSQSDSGPDSEQMTASTADHSTSQTSKSSDNDQTPAQTQSSPSTLDQIQQREQMQQHSETDANGGSYTSTDNAAGKQDNNSQQGATTNQSDSGPDSRQPTTSTAGQSTSQAPQNSGNDQKPDSTSTPDQKQQSPAAQQTRGNHSGLSGDTSGQNRAQSRDTVNQESNKQAAPNSNPQASAGAQQHGNPDTDNTANSSANTPAAKPQGANAQQPGDTGRDSTSTPDQKQQSPAAQQTRGNHSGLSDDTSGQNRAQSRDTVNQESNKQAAPNSNPQASAGAQQHGNPDTDNTTNSSANTPGAKPQGANAQQPGDTGRDSTSTPDQKQQSPAAQQTRGDHSSLPGDTSGQNRAQSRDTVNQESNKQAAPNSNPQASAGAQQHGNPDTDNTANSSANTPAAKPQGANAQQPGDTGRDSTSTPDQKQQSPAAQQTRGDHSSLPGDTSGQNRAQSRDTVNQESNKQAAPNSNPQASAGAQQHGNPDTDNTANSSANTPAAKPQGANAQQPGDTGRDSTSTPDQKQQSPAAQQTRGDHSGILGDTSGRNHTQSRHAANQEPSGHATPNSNPQASAGAQQQSDPNAANTANSSTGAPAASATAQQSPGTASELVLSNDVADKWQKFTDAQNRVQNDIDNNKDTTDDMIAAARAYNDAVKQMEQEAPDDDQKKRISALENALNHAKPGDSLETIEKNANVPLPALHKKSIADQYGTYGKAPSTFSRMAIFDEARFNNSKVLQGTPLGRFQRPGQSVLDPIGHNGRLGVLFGTRFNAAASNFTKAGTKFMSGIQKMKNHQDPTDDFVEGGAALGQGVNEMSAGALTDYGNHLAKLQSGKQPPAAQTQQPPKSPEPHPGTSSEYKNFGPDDPLHDSVINGEGNQEASIDQQIADQQKTIEKKITDKIDHGSRDVAQLNLQDGVEENKGEYLAMQDLGKTLRSSAQDAMKDANENIKQIDKRAQPLMDQLKEYGYDSLDAARASQDSNVKNLVGQLDEYGYLKQQAYEQFNHAMDQYEATIKNASGAFSELSDIMKKTPLEERGAKLSDWADRYGKSFAKYQNGLLTSTDSLPEWFKISKPLRAQMVPAAIGTAFAAAGFGASLDNYLKKQAAGTLTTQDKIAFGGQVVNLISGLAGFIPVAGPLVSMALAVTGVVLSGLADQYPQWQQDEAVAKWKENIRERYNKEHPGREIAEPFDGD
ncbi:hypothetical protein [Paraburkholderia sacchari]|uniref:hypothetical protein n=1 Tax=Paraburkholderia sacchari TaxID=159450 RepID=UPI001BCBCD13|nr:hypothetical protein [Paraburkholderia sacchari]